jgi:hypothetical protein
VSRHFGRLVLPTPAEGNVASGDHVRSNLSDGILVDIGVTGILVVRT